MTILDTIIEHKRKEVSAKKEAFSIKHLEQSSYFERSTLSLASAIKNSGTGIIAEHKRRSPSKNNINNNSKIDAIASGYQKARVSGMSILTDTRFFGGALEDLLIARSHTTLPLLRKEFIIDAYQIIEAKAYGADAILLIAACLSAKQLVEFSELAYSLGLEVLLEVHNEAELIKAILPKVTMIGVNNRNLKTFKTSTKTSKELAIKIPEEYVKVSESGISTVETIKELKEYGYQGFLMGEHFMKNESPSETAKNFIENLRS